MVTNHYKNERCKREKFIKEFLGGDGEIIDSFIVDKSHKHGKERHDISDKGIIIIYNTETNKLVTKLIAREWQLKKLYNNVGREPPSWLIYLARYHESLNYNYI